MAYCRCRRRVLQSDSAAMAFAAAQADGYISAAQGLRSIPSAGCRALGPTAPGASLLEPGRRLRRRARGGFRRGVRVDSPAVMDVLAEVAAAEAAHIVARPWRAFPAPEPNWWLAAVSSRVTAVSSRVSRVKAIVPECPFAQFARWLR